MEPPKKLITRLLEFCLMLALCALLINLAARWIMDVWKILLIIILIALTAIISYRVWKYKKDKGQW